MKLQKRTLRLGYSFPLFTAVISALMLMSAFAPKANALVTELLVYYNFNQGTSFPQLSVAPGLETGIHLDNADAYGLPNKFDSGNLKIDTTAGTTVNGVTGETAGGALDARGNTTTGLPNPATPSCFVIGPFTNNNLDGSISFALKSTGTGQFTTLNLLYSTNGTTFTNFATFTNLHQYTTYTTLSANLPNAAHSSTTYIEFCFTGASNNNTNNNTFIDNIQITGEVPEPTTYIGGALGVVGLCWFQRRRFRSLRLRRT
jgi:hypothetical protein